MSQTLLRRAIGSGHLEVVRGDLTLECVDAIVNAANSALQHGGGVAGAIVRRGGAIIQEESDRKAPVPVGGAVATGAGGLACRFVIHAVGPVWGAGDEEAKLSRAVASALACGEELKLESVALPAISTGIFGYPKADGCGVIVDAAVRHLEAKVARSIRLIRLVSLDEETASHFLEASRRRC